MELIENNEEVIQPKNLTYETSGSDRLLSIALRRLEVLENDMKDMKTDKLISETQLSREMLDENGLLPIVKKTKRGRGYRPLLKSEIEEAQQKSRTAMAAARYLNVNYPLYRKYARLYGIHVIDRHAPRKSNIYSPEKGKYPLAKILANEYPDLDDYTVKDKLIRSGLLPARCNICGYYRRRITDNKIAILLDHMDGNRSNFKIGNLQLLCLNCTFECGRGYIRSGNKTFDVDIIQGAVRQDIRPEARY